MSISDEVRRCPLCDEEREIKQLYYHLQIYHNKSELAEQLLKGKAEPGFISQSDELASSGGSATVQNRSHDSECDDEQDSNSTGGDDPMSGTN